MKILTEALAKKARAEKNLAIIALAKKIFAKKVAKRRSDADKERLADEADWNRQQSEEILREVKEAGSWEAWEAQEVAREKYEQSMRDDPPPYDEVAMDLMMQNYEPMPPEEELPSLEHQEAEQILLDVAEAGGWDAWEAQEAAREKHEQSNLDNPPLDGELLSIDELLNSEPEPPEKGEPGT